MFFCIGPGFWSRVGSPNAGRPDSSSIQWSVLEYLTLFLIVLMHEFGHSLACRQVGGQANGIVLWPLGGVAYVSPPQRPGAMLMEYRSRAAGECGALPGIFYHLVAGIFSRLIETAAGPLSYTS